MPGWEAIPTKLRDGYGEYSIDSFHVIECPLFQEDPAMTIESGGRQPRVEMDTIAVYLERGYSDSRISALTGLSLSTVSQKRQRLIREKGKGK